MRITARSRGATTSVSVIAAFPIVALTSFVLGYWFANYGPAAISSSALTVHDIALLGSSTNMASSSSSSSLTSSSQQQQEQRSLPVVDNNDSINNINNNNNKGWRSIDVFYGTADHLPVGNRDYFGQVKQDRIVLSLLHHKRQGYFVDLAANHAVYRSNSLALERQADWQGLCIEPNPMYWKDLSYRTCQTVGAIVGATRDETVHFAFEKKEWGGLVGQGFDNAHFELPKGARPQSTVTLHEILQRYQAPHDIDYLSLDVEGAESFVLMVFPLDEYRIKILTGERLKPDVQVFLRSHHFEMLGYLSKWGEQLWINQDFIHEMNVKETLHKFPFYNMTDFGKSLK